MRPKGASAGAVLTRRIKKTAKHGASAGAAQSTGDLLGPAAAAAVAPAANKLSKQKAPGGRGLDDQLVKLGITRDQDLVLHLPLRYEDHTRIVPLSSLLPGTTVQSEGVIVDVDIQYRPRRQLVASIADETIDAHGTKRRGHLVLRFFHFYPSMQKALAPGKQVRVFGEVRDGHFGLEI